MKVFEEIYEELLNSDNNQLNNIWEEAQKERNKAKKISWITCLVIDIFVIILFFNTGIKLNSIIAILIALILLFMIDMVVIIVINIIFSKNTNKYNLMFKEIVIKKLMKNFYDNLEYFPNKEMPEYIYENVQYEYYDIYESDDYMEGLINNKYSIQMAEIETKEEQEYEDSEGETQTREITKFHGLFAKIELEKSINDELRIMQNGKTAFWDNNKLKMDSNEFEKYFDVQISNKILGMQLLTADVMEELVDFENKTKMKFDICIKGNELYLRFHSGDMFEATDFKKGPLNKKIIQKYFYMLNFIYNLSNRMINLINQTEV